MTTNNSFNNQAPRGCLFATKDYTSADILGMFATPVSFLPRPGAGLVYLGMQKQLILFHGGTSYTGGGQPQLQFETTSNNYRWNASAITATSTSQFTLNLGGVAPSSVNEALNMSNLTGAFLTGNGTMRINFWYYLIQLN